MSISDKEILENRKKVIEFLKSPTLQKERYRLENAYDTNRRCCLGHMCHVLHLKRAVREINGIEHVLYDEHNTTAPDTLIKLIGLNDKWGSFYKDGGVQDCLSNMNDFTEMTPQEIGVYLESVIMGGPETPWKAISD